MIVFPLLAVSFIMKVAAILFVLCAVLLILIILIQKGKGGGLSAAFGSGLASGILGSKTGDFLTWVTIVLVGIFLSLALVMAKFYRPTISEFGTEQAVQKEATSEKPTPQADFNKPRTTGTDENADANSSGG